MCIESESLPRSSCLKCIEKRMMAADLCNQLPLFSGRSIYFATFCHLSMFQPDNYVAIVLPAQSSDMVHTPPPSRLPSLLHQPTLKHYIHTPHTHSLHPNTLTQQQAPQCHNHPQTGTPHTFYQVQFPSSLPVLSSLFCLSAYMYISAFRDIQPTDLSI